MNGLTDDYYSVLQNDWPSAGGKYLSDKDKPNQLPITPEVETDDEIDNSWLPYIILGVIVIALLALLISTIITLLPH